MNRAHRDRTRGHGADEIGEIARDLKRAAIELRTFSLLTEPERELVQAFARRMRGCAADLAREPRLVDGVNAVAEALGELLDRDRAARAAAIEPG